MLRGLDSPPSQEQLLPGFEEYFKPQTQDLYAQWEAAGEREKKSRTIYAQHGMKTAEVHQGIGGRPSGHWDGCGRGDLCS